MFSYAVQLSVNGVSRYLLTGVHPLREEDSTCGVSGGGKYLLSVHVKDTYVKLFKDIHAVLISNCRTTKWILTRPFLSGFMVKLNHLILLGETTFICMFIIDILLGTSFKQLWVVLL